MKKYNRYIVFSKTPLESYFRFEDKFQIFPLINDQIPKHKLAKHFPIILEYWYDDSEKLTLTGGYEPLRNLSNETGLNMIKVNQIITLLSVVTNHTFFIYNELNGYWSIEIPDFLIKPTLT